MPMTRQSLWSDRLDRFCAVLGGLLPVGIIIGNTAYESMLALVGLCWMARCILQRENPLPVLRTHPLVWPWVLMFISIVLSLAINGPGNKGAAHDIVYLRHLLFLLAMLDISRRKPVMRYFLMGIAASILLAALNLVAAKIIGWDLLGNPAARYTSKLKEAARISGLFAYFGPMMMAWAFSFTLLEKKRRYALLALGLLAMAILFDMRIRTAIIGAGAGVGVWIMYLLYMRYGLKSLAVTIPVAAIVSVLLVLYIAQQPAFKIYSVYDRFGYYKVIWAIIQEHPVFGVGISGFQDATREMAASGKITPVVSPDGVQWLEAEILHAHNLLLMIVSCTGGVGLVIFSWLFFRVARMTYLQTDEQYRAGLVLWPPLLLVIGLTGWSIYANWYHALFVYLTAMTGILRHEKVESGSTVS